MDSLSRDASSAIEYNYKYQLIKIIGRGAYGQVYKALNLYENKFVAMKILTLTMEEAAVYDNREVTILDSLNHENVVKMWEAGSNPDHAAGQIVVHIALEFCHFELFELLRDPNVKFSLPEIKNIFLQLLTGLEYLHSKNVLHRDIKTENILITEMGVLKIADFGLARLFHRNANDEGINLSNKVVALWYRPPELLLGHTTYGPAIDMWSAGCVMGELWLRMPLLSGHNAKEQLKNISQLCGSINPDVWPGVDTFRLYSQMELEQGYPRNVKNKMKLFLTDPPACDLLDKLLILDPRGRWTAKQALHHEFFTAQPKPCTLKKVINERRISEFLYTPDQTMPYYDRYELDNQSPE